MRLNSNKGKTSNPTINLDSVFFNNKTFLKSVATPATSINLNGKTLVNSDSDSARFNEDSEIDVNIDNSSDNHVGLKLDSDIGSDLYSKIGS